MSFVSSSRRPELFVGITMWHSGLFLPHCLRSLRPTTVGLRVTVGVVDNRSTDDSVEIARQHGSEVEVTHCSQAVALNRLLSRSRAARTLLLHSDVVFVGPRWFEVCA